MAVLRPDIVMEEGVGRPAGALRFSAAEACSRKQPGKKETREEDAGKKVKKKEGGG